MENAPPRASSDDAALPDDPSCGYCGESSPGDMISVLWMGGTTLTTPTWFHVQCLVSEASNMRDKLLAVDTRYPH
jgi:hypothetical protein